MDRTGAAALVVVAGMLVAAQAPMNGELGRHVGSWQAALVNFAVGTALIVLLIAVFGGGFGELRGVTAAPWWALLGGVVGVVVVVASLVAVRSLGAGGVTAATVAGMLAASVVVDHLGLLGVEPRPVGAAKILGIALLAGGVMLVVRE